LGSRRQFGDKTVVVTGAAGGMGGAICRRFGRAGAKLGMLDLHEDPLRQMQEELASEGVKSLPLVCDVTDLDACNRAMDAVIDEFGGVDVLVNNAGVTHFSLMTDTSMDTYRKVMDVNFFGAVHCTRTAIDSLVERRGLLIAVSSIAGFAPLYHRTGYSASKHALHGFFGSLRTEIKSKGVDVLIACPGFTATGIAKNALGGDGGPAVEPQSTVGGAVSPDSVADAIFKAARRGDRLLVLSVVGRITHWLVRFCPPVYEWLMLRSLK